MLTYIFCSSHARQETKQAEEAILDIGTETDRDTMAGIIDLKVIEERRVQTIAVSTLLEDVDLSGSGRNRLVLDVGGEERAILDALRRSSLLDKFHVVEVRCGEIALFESSMTVSELRRWMTEAGFAYRSRDDSLDPDLPLLTFDLSADRHEARLLQSELKPPDAI